MNMVMVAIRDSAVDAYMPPITVRAIGEGVQMFSDEVNRKAENNNLAMHPEDFELWLVGEFSSRDGTILEVERRVLARGKDVVQS